MEATAPPVQTGYFDPNNPGRESLEENKHTLSLLKSPKVTMSKDFQNVFSGQAYVPPPAYYNDPPPGYSDDRSKKND